MQHQKQKGSAAVELAIILFPMVILCLGITEYGRALYYYNGLVKATRGAARQLSMQSYKALAQGSGITAEQANIINGTLAQGRNLAYCGKSDCTGQSALVPGLQTTNIRVCYPYGTVSGCPTSMITSVGSSPATPVGMVSVTISGFRFTPLYFPPIAFQPISLTMAAGIN